MSSKKYVYLQNRLPMHAVYFPNNCRRSSVVRTPDSESKDPQFDSLKIKLCSPHFCFIPPPFNENDRKVYWFLSPTYFIEKKISKRLKIVVFTENPFCLAIIKRNFVHMNIKLYIKHNRSWLAACPDTCMSPCRAVSLIVFYLHFCQNWDMHIDGIVRTRSNSSYTLKLNQKSKSTIHQSKWCICQEIAIWPCQFSDLLSNILFTSLFQFKKRSHAF